MKINHGLLLLSCHPCSKRLSTILKQACSLVQKTLYVDVQPWQQETPTRRQLHHVMELVYGHHMNSNSIDVRLLLPSTSAVRTLSRPISLFILEQDMKSDPLESLSNRYIPCSSDVTIEHVEVSRVDDSAEENGSTEDDLKVYFITCQELSTFSIVATFQILV